MSSKKLLFVVMDGVGETDHEFGNAFKLAYTPYLDYLKSQALFTTLYAHGTYVGLPSDNDIGNSEVGHNAIGAGRVYDQGAKLVQNSIREGTLFTGKVWSNIVKAVGSRHTLHFIGLLSDGNVHSHIDHLLAMLRAAVKSGVEKIRLHILLDGRDVGEKSCEVYIERLFREMAVLNEHSDIKVASGGGRMTTTMDRYEADWSMVERGWQAHVLGEAEYYFHNLDDAIKEFRAKPNLTDQYMPSFVITDSQAKPVGRIEDGDGVIFFNFRGDRAIEISRAFEEADFAAFDRKRFPKVHYAGMMEYDGDLHIPKNYLVTPPTISNTLGEHLSGLGLRQFACSETQKFGHVTYFWNGNRSGMYEPKLEEYLEIPSDNIEFDRKPWMKAFEICEATKERMRRGSFDFARINFANGDMVGHTGNLEAAVAAMTTVDMMVGQLYKTALETDTILVITADHGNCDEMFDAKAKDYPNWQQLDPLHLPKPKTSHTKNKVPLYIVEPAGTKYHWRGVAQAGLANLAATVCELMGIAADKHFLPSLIEKD